MANPSIVAGKILPVIRVPLTDGCDYLWTWQRSDGTAPAAGDVFKYEWDNGTTWTATIVGADITFSQSAAAVDAIPDGEGLMFVRVTSGGFRDPLAVGTAIRQPRDRS